MGRRLLPALKGAAGSSQVTGQKRKDKEAKVATARDMSAPAINNHGGFGRWAFLEIRDPWNAQNEIRAFAAPCQTSPRSDS